MGETGASRHAAALVCMVVFVASAAAREGIIIDDALIYQNFARSALHGHGLVYGPGHTAEGYSSPAWMLLLLGLGHLGLIGFQVAKVAGLLLGAACIAVVTLSAPRTLRFPERTLLGLLLAVQPGIAWWSSSGMETPLAMLLVTACVAAAVSDRYRLTAGLAGLAFLSRPEGAIYTLPVLLWLAYRWRHLGLPRRDLAIWAALAAVPGLLWHCYRALAYGTLVANSALAKLGNARLDTPRGATAGLSYCGTALLEYAGIWLALTVCVWTWCRSCRSGDHRELSNWILLAAMLGSTILFVLGVRGDWMPFARFFVPVLPAVVVVLAVQLDAATGRRRTILHLGLLAAFATGAIQQLTESAAALPDHRIPFADPAWVGPGALYYTGALLQFTKPGDAVLHVDIGQSGYIANDLRFMDAYGLVSRFEAEYLAGRHTDAELVAHFQELSPTVVFFVVRAGTMDPVLKTTAPLRDSLQSGYRGVHRRPWWDNTELIVLVRTDALGRSIDSARARAWKQAARGLQLVSPQTDSR